MEPTGSLLHLQVPATCPYPKPDQSSPCPHIPVPEDIIYQITTEKTHSYITKSLIY